MRSWCIRSLVALAAIAMFALPPSANGSDDNPPKQGPRSMHELLARSKARAMMDQEFAEFFHQPRDLPCTQENYDVRFYDVAVTVDDTTETLYGRVTFVADATEAGVEEIQVDLGAFMTIDSIVGVSGPLSYSREGDVVILQLDQIYNQGEQFTFDFYYHGRPDDNPEYYVGGFFFDERLTTYPESGGAWKRVFYTTCEPYDSRDWWPCKDRPDDKPDSMKTSFTVDHYYYVMSNGFLDSVITPIAKPRVRIYYYTEPYPIATYLFSVAATDYVVDEDWWYYNDGADSMPYINAVYPEVEEEALQHYAHGKMGLTYLSQGYGLYPFVDCKYGNADTEIPGMEHQTVSSIWGIHRIDLEEWYPGWYSWRDLIVHELAHQWWGDYITCKSWPHIWLNEGWATYSEALHLQLRFGWQEYFEHMESLDFADGGTIYRADTADPYNVFDYIVYHKGAWVAHMLRGLVGDSLFFAGLEGCFSSEYAWGSWDTEEFQELWEDFTGMDLSAFFEDWIYGQYRPTYAPCWVCQPDGQGGYDTYLAIDQKQTTEPQVFRMPIEIIVQLTSGPTDTMTVNCDRRKKLFYFNFPDSMIGIEIDPANWVLNYRMSGTWGIRVLHEENLPDAGLNIAYDLPLAAHGGSGFFDWSISGGSLPAGLTMDSLGYIYGIPTDTGHFEFSIYLDDLHGGGWAEETFWMEVAAVELVPGDIDLSGELDIADLIYLVSYMFQEGPEPLSWNTCDVDASCALDIADLVYLVTYMFQEGPSPQIGCII